MHRLQAVESGYDTRQISFSRINEIYDRLGTSKVFSILHVKSGYL